MQPIHPPGFYPHVAIPVEPILRQQPISRTETIRLTAQGHLVIHHPIPDKLESRIKYTSAPEFTRLTYTAVTCDPNEFPHSYTLRTNHLNRETEIVICITMYNEPATLLCKTLYAIFDNIKHLSARSRSSTWGKQAWNKIVVCIIADGREKIHPSVLDALGVMGLYQEGLMKNTVRGEAVTAHLFEHSSQLCLDGEFVIHDHQEGLPPVQMMFCLKEKNAKKINSHRWFFNAFCPLLRPNVCILIDAGTKPNDAAIYHLWKAFDRNASVGGACGEIYCELGSGCTNLLNPLVAAQNFEYKMSNILDKPLESFLGYIAVLPGAFSAYRYKAVLGVPLNSYFKGEKMHGGDDIFSANMYLAEDRVLCFELVTKKGHSWLLKYVKSAKAETDVPDGVAEFISQRRRWLNGSFFASVHALSHWYNIFRSRHNPLRMLTLFIQFIYNFAQLTLSWFALVRFISIYIL